MVSRRRLRRLTDRSSPKSGSDVTSVLDAVRQAHAAGLCVLPVRGDGSKAPDVASWGPFQLARPSVELMRGGISHTGTGSA